MWRQLWGYISSRFEKTDRWKSWNPLSGLLLSSVWNINCLRYQIFKISCLKVQTVSKTYSDVKKTVHIFIVYISSSFYPIFKIFFFNWSEICILQDSHIRSEKSESRNFRRHIDLQTLPVDFQRPTHGWFGYKPFQTLGACIRPLGACIPSCRL